MQLDAVVYILVRLVAMRCKRRRWCAHARTASVPVGWEHARTGGGGTSVIGVWVMW